MCPIEGLSNIVRMPRLGKIHLGIKVEKPGKHPYPQATDYFVCPPEIQKVFGEKPKELDIMFPTEDETAFCQQWLRCYSRTQGLICLGDGVTARQKTDLATGAIADHNTKDWEWRDELTCNPQECPAYLSKHCRRVMNLQVLIPQIPGLGVWQIDTSSFYSIINVNSMIKLLKNLAGRCSFIPLKLFLGPIEVTPPGQSKKTVHIMYLKQDMTLAEIARLGQVPAPLALLPEPDVEEMPEDLFPEEVLQNDAPHRGTPSPEIEDQETALEDDLFPRPSEAAPFPREEAIGEIRAFFKRKAWMKPTIESWLLQKVRYRTLDECPNELLSRLLNEIQDAQLSFDCDSSES